jgi:hypothetical protein
MALDIDLIDPILDEEGDADDGLGPYLYLLDGSSATETFKWRSLMLKEQGVYLSSIQESRAQEFEERLNDRSFFEKRLFIPWAMLSELTIDDSVVQINWFDLAKGKDAKTRFRFEHEEDATMVVRIMTEKKNWKAHYRSSTVWRGLLSYGLGMLLTAGLTWVLLSDASEIERGIEPILEGRRVATKLLFWKIAGGLGTNGVWVLGSSVMFLMIGSTYRWYRGRQPAIVWRNGN